MALSELLPRQNASAPLTAAALDLMASVIARELNVDQIESAAHLAASTLQWFPTPRQFLALAGRATPEDQSRAEELAAWDALKAWVASNEWRLRNMHTGVLGWVDHAAEWSGSHAPLEPLPPRIEYACRHVGGPEAVRRATAPGEEETWLRREFCEAYRHAPEIERQAHAILGAAVALPQLRAIPG